jgi:formamidopyrimidine-DNA glycosylase
VFVPELPEVETVVRKVRPELTGARILDIQVFRELSLKPQATADLAPVIGRRVAYIDRRGKNILIYLQPAKAKPDQPSVVAIRIHLGMTGELLVKPATFEATRSTRVLFKLNGKRLLVFEDMRLLGRVHALTPQQLEDLRKKVGIEPLSGEFTPQVFLDAALSSRSPAKLFLLGQDRIAGVGNMYAAESLWRARIDPRKPMNSVPRAKLLALHEAIPAVLREALKGALKTYEKPGFYDTMDFAVYGRKGEPCQRCSRPIERIEQSGRSTYFCPKCQR